jgi:hypothetical protein
MVLESQFPCLAILSGSQSTYIYRVPQCMSPPGIGTPPTPQPQASVPLPLEPGGGGTLACG